MRKSSYFSFIIALFLFVAFNSFAQEKSETADLKGVNIDYVLKHRVINPQPITHFTETNELFTSGSPINAPGAGPGGSDGSVLQTALLLSTFGSSFNNAGGYTIADDCDIVGSTWNIDSIKVYGYQTGSTTTSTFTGLYLRVWSGDPTAGGTVVWGDLTTNIMARTAWTGAYRYTDTAPGTTRPVMLIVGATVGLSLPAGSYWFEFGTTGSLASGPWGPPVTITGQTVTGNGKQHNTTTNVWTSLVDNTVDAQGVPFTLYGTTGAAQGPGPATAPTPANGATNVAITGVSATWTNPATATTQKVYFSADMAAVQNMDAAALVYSGSVLSTFALPGLEYSTTYYWRVIETDPTGTTNGSVWNFKTMRDPATFVEDFESGTGLWTITGSNSLYVWALFATSGYMLPATASGNALVGNSDEWGSTAGAQTTTATLTNGLNMSSFDHVYLEFDSDFHIYSSSQDQGWCDISVDGGTTWTNVYYIIGVDDRTAHKLYDITNIAAGKSSVQVRFTYANTGWNWYWAIDNVSLYGSGAIPVELTNFSANVIDGKAMLNWATATETNNSGFAIERSADNSIFEQINFVTGNGTTTEKHIYSYADASVVSGTYYYRLKQIDFDGTASYSNTVEVTIGLPVDFSMDQNYPNPFNPTTTIRFAVPVDANVTISLYNSLGQQVATMVEGNYAAGSHEFNFNASSISSGVYFYTIEANGVNGKNFTATKKMALMK